MAETSPCPTTNLFPLPFPQPASSPLQVSDLVASTCASTLDMKPSFLCCGEDRGDLKGLLAHMEKAHVSDGSVGSSEDGHSSAEQDAPVSLAVPKLPVHRLRSASSPKTTRSQNSTPVKRKMLRASGVSVKEGWKTKEREVPYDAATLQNRSSTSTPSAALPTHSHPSGLEISVSGKRYIPPALKKFACTTPGCDKRYENTNGLKYHKSKGTCNQYNSPLGIKEKQASKRYRCHVLSCGKEYTSFVLALLLLFLLGNH